MKARFSLSTILLYTAVLAVVFAYCACLRIREGTPRMVNGVWYFQLPSDTAPERRLTISELAIRAAVFSTFGFWICRKITKKMNANDLES